MSQLPLSTRGSVPFLRESNSTVPRETGGNDTERTPADISQYYQSRRSGLQAFSYPRGIGTSAEHPHWLQIKIHVNSSNPLIGATGLGNASGTFVPPEVNQGAMDVSSRATQARVQAAAYGTGAANSLGSFSIAGKLLGGAAGVAAGLAIGGLSTPTTYTTLNSVIALGLQEAPTADYATVWESQDLGEFLSQGDISPLSIGSEFIRGNAGLKGALGQASGLNNAGAAMEKARGAIRNPYKEQLFKQVEFRTFNFNFNFLPDSQAEAMNLINMYRTLRASMLPARSKDGFYLVYPAQYSLTYMYKQSRNVAVPAIGTCIMTGLTAKYGGTDFVTFQNTPGVPAEFSLSMKFKEIIPITADQVIGGGL
jgi:hypothetical protein